MHKKLMRRKLLKAVAVASGGILVACIQGTENAFSSTSAKPVETTASSLAEATAAPAATPSTSTAATVANVSSSAAAEASVTISLPIVMNGTPSPIPTNGRVVHVHANSAITWNLSATNYWDYVNQSVVDNMVDQGITSLTGQSTLADAYRSLFKNGYTAGNVIAVKVSFNNCSFSEDRCRNPVEGYIDEVKEPIDALIRGLKAAGVREQDIWVYETTRNLPLRFTDPMKARYPSVKFVDWSCNNPCPAYDWVGTRAQNAYIDFHPPAPIPTPAERRVTDVLVNAKYLINVPIMKKHGQAGISLGFKNHIGTLDDPISMHPWIFINQGAHFSSTYNPLIEMYQNANIGPKTILTIGDGLFSAFSHDAAPVPWATFGNNVPKSLFFATDPVAIDSVMADHIYAELGVFDLDHRSRYYLPLAEQAGLGIYESGNPWTNNYHEIKYVKHEL